MIDYEQMNRSQLAQLKQAMSDVRKGYKSFLDLVGEVEVLVGKELTENEVANIESMILSGQYLFLDRHYLEC